MNQVLFIPTSAKKVFATVAIATLLASTLPLGVMTAEAARTGVSVAAQSVSTADTNVNIALAASVSDDGDNSDTATLTVNDGGMGGVFSNGTLGGVCSAELGAGPQNITVAAGTGNKGFCYKNATAGTYTITVDMATTSAVIGSDTIDLTITTPAPLFEENAVCAVGCEYTTLADAVAGESDGQTITMKAETHTITSTVTVNKDLTIVGEVGNVIQTSGGSYALSITASGVTIDGLVFDKTDSVNQNIIHINANNVTIENSTFSGNYVDGAGEVTRAMEISGGLTGLSLDGNNITNLRQPAYINNTTSGSITNNFVGDTRGWVIVSDTSLTFTGNSWGTNAVDIAIIDQGGSANNYTCEIVAQIVIDNNNADVNNQVQTTPCPPIVVPPSCSTTDTLADTTFDTFANGSVNGQNGWQVTNASFDQEVVDNTYGYGSFGCQSLRISSAFASGSFGDQIFSASVTNEAGETSAENGGLSGGTRQTRFDASWDFASTNPSAEQPGLSVVVSPDRGDGARMSWVQMTDTPTGLAINFNEYTGGAFVQTNLASDLDRSVPHNVRVVMDFVDGAGNDVVEVYVNGVLEHTGTSWEDYFRNVETNPTRTVDSLLFRMSVAAPATLDNGFLIDNVSIETGATPPPAPKTTNTVVVSGDTAAGENQPGWLFNRDTSTATPFEFNPDQSVIGNGALYVLPIGGVTPSDKFIAEYFALTEMGDIDSFSYDFNMGSGATTTDAEEFYLSVYANFGVSSPTKFYDCRYNVIPTTGVVGGWTTVTFDPTQSYSVTTRTGGEASPFACPSSPAAMGADATIRAFAINLGDTSLNDAGIDGYFDNVVFETDTHVTTFDLDPTPTSSGGGGGGGSSGGRRSSSDDGPTPQVLGASTDDEILALLNAIEVRLYELLAESYANQQGPVTTTPGTTTTVTPTVTENDEEEVTEDEETDASTSSVVEEEDDTNLDELVATIPWDKLVWLLVAAWLLASAGAYWYRSSHPGSLALRAVQGVFGVIGLVLLVSFFAFGLAGALFWPSLILAVGATTAYFWILD